MGWARLAALVAWLGTIGGCSLTAPSDADLMGGGAHPAENDAGRDASTREAGSEAGGNLCEPGQTCTCSSAGSCSETCDGSGCNFQCAGSGDCSFSCPGGGCTVTATGSGDVSLNCPGNNCTVNCNGSGNCSVHQCNQGCSCHGC